MTHRILEGIRIIDWTQAQVGPYTTVLLADLGADVIHVEDRKGGDQSRGYRFAFGRNLELPAGRNIVFETVNQGKRGIVCDLNKPEGRELIYRLVAKSDVFVCNFRKPESKGMDYATLRKYNPKLIYARGTAFGSRGPDKDSPGLEMAAIARGGMMVASSPAGCPPTYVVPAMVDRITSVFIANGILGALLARERWGIGQQIDASQLSAIIAIANLPILTVLWGRGEMERVDRKTVHNPLYNIYECKDGRWIALSMYQEVKYWAPFCQCIGLPNLVNDPRFNDSAKRAENSKELVKILDQIFLGKTAKEWIPILQKGDMNFSEINTMADIPSDPQVIANNYIIEWEHPVLGKMKSPGHPVEYSVTPPVPPSAAPELGQHTEEVMLELGYTWEDIGVLKDKEVI